MIYFVVVSLTTIKNNIFFNEGNHSTYYKFVRRIYVSVGEALRPEPDILEVCTVAGGKGDG